jgi:hypothetical protein
MATTPASALAAGALNTGGTATTTGSVTADTTACYYIFITARHATTGFANPDTTTVSGMGLTWARVAEVFANSNQEMLVCFEGYGTPTTGALTITLSQTPASGMHHVVVVPNARRASSPTRASWTGSGTGTTGTVSPAGIGGAVLLGAFSHAANELVTPDTTYVPWVEIADSGTTSIQLEDQYTLSGGDKTFTATWATSSRWMGIALEMASYTYGSFGVADDDLDGLDPAISILTEDEEGPTVAGKPSGVWAVIGGAG